MQSFFLDMLHFAVPNQFAEAYRNLQDINRRHVYVHEPLIYDAVWLATTALHHSEELLGQQFNSTHNTTSGIPLIEAALQFALTNYSRNYTGLTVSLMYHVHDDTHTRGSNMNNIMLFQLGLLDQRQQLCVIFE